MIFVIFIVLLFALVGAFQYQQSYAKQVAASKHYAQTDRKPLQSIFKLLHLS